MLHVTNVTCYMLQMVQVICCLFLNKVDSILLLFFNIWVSVLIELTFLFDVRWLVFLTSLTLFPRKFTLDGIRWLFVLNYWLRTGFVDFEKPMKNTRGCYAAGSRQPETIIAHAAVGGFAGGYAYDGSYMNSTTHRGVREKWCVLTVWCNYSAPLNMNPTNVLR